MHQFNYDQPNATEDKAASTHFEFYRWLNATQGKEVEDIHYDEPGNFLSSRYPDTPDHSNWEYCVNRFLAHTSKEYAIEDVPTIKQMTGPFSVQPGVFTMQPIKYYFLHLFLVLISSGPGWEIITGCSVGWGCNPEHIIRIHDDALAVQFKLMFS
jgi:hypothetical protein